MRHKKLWIQLCAVVCILIPLIVWVNMYAANSQTLESIVVRFGYTGLFLVSVLSGFNVVFPVPVMSFFAFFQEVGFTPLITVLVVAIGMTIGDMIGFLIGHTTRDMLSDVQTKNLQRLQALEEKHQALPYAFLAVYAAFVPFPNELVVIPLALFGGRFRYIVIAVFCGNIIHNVLWALGVGAIFN